MYLSAILMIRVHSHLSVRIFESLNHYWLHLRHAPRAHLSSLGVHRPVIRFVFWDFALPDSSSHTTFFLRLREEFWSRNWVSKSCEISRYEIQFYWPEEIIVMLQTCQCRTLAFKVSFYTGCHRVALLASEVVKAPRGNLCFLENISQISMIAELLYGC